MDYRGCLCLFNQERKENEKICMLVAVALVAGDPAIYERI